MIAGNNHIDKEDFLSLYPAARAKVLPQAIYAMDLQGLGLSHLIKTGFLQKLHFAFGHQYRQL